MSLVAALLAWAGAVALVVACLVPVLEYADGTAFRLLDLDQSRARLAYALEPVAAAVVAAVLGGLVGIGGGARLAAGLVVAGLWMLAFFLTYAITLGLEQSTLSDLGPGVGTGLAGGALVLAAGLAVLLEARVLAALRAPGEPEPPRPAEPAPEEGAGQPPAGWYADPAGEAAARYWDGARWTHDTRG